MELIFFSSKIILISGLFFGYYWFFLRNKVFHLYNRYYLLGAVILPVLLPLLPLALPQLTAFLKKTGPLRLMEVVTGNAETMQNAAVGTENAHNLFNWLGILQWVWILGFCALLSMTLRSARYLINLSRNHEYQILKNVRFYMTREKGSPFSFFNRIFWHQDLVIDSDEGQQIFRHELYHVRQLHSFDVLLLELFCAIGWFNPFYHLIKRELRAIHEFLADHYAVSDDNRYAYAELLLLHTITQKKQELAIPFFHNHLKRRIHMLTQLKNKPKNYFSRIMILPLVILIFCAFAAGVKNELSKQQSHRIKVVIDAGHGGIDAGAFNTAGLKEKDLDLQLAKKIQALAGEFNIDVIMTRETDILPGNSTNIREGLIARTDLANQKKADLFVSLHLNKDESNSGKHGFEVYVSQRSAYYSKAVALGSCISQSLKSDYDVADQLKQSDSVRVLRSAEMPSVLIECGFIDNAGDIQLLYSDAGLEKMARDILKGIDAFRKSGATALTTMPKRSRTDTLTNKQMAGLNPGDFEAMYVDKRSKYCRIDMKNGDRHYIDLSYVKSQRNK